ncbi:hypothetical protein [Pseudomonas chlororaphis]|uniref:hypothetical protein n=1 Tax=Pseudomonas chlororaphis TaxID=587753 RepID=UPI002D79955D|nr:hypothetical protein [Pseudomonas chlororaphis]
MKSDELLQTIRTEILLQFGVKVSELDPMFATVLANKIAMKAFTQPIVSAVESIPGLIEASLEVVASAVEEAEKTADTLVAETKANLFAVSKLELEASHQRIKEAIGTIVESTLAESLGRVQSDFTALQRNVKEVSGQFRGKNAARVNIILSGALVLLLGLFSTGMFALYTVGMENLKDAQAWKALYEEQQSVVRDLPPAIKKQFNFPAARG